MLHENGLSISCPPVLRKNMFTTGAVDNIDHNPTATTAQTSLHGTRESIFQHPNTENPGDEREPLKVGSNMKFKKSQSFQKITPNYITKRSTPPVASKSSPLPESW
ncbi:hypothetical protein SNE40_002493 [Patella caerulea]|uniref:Uncharacterized protein n=1 Tax=Patella caerulea TaxID=87958 RepID=A0AAN8PZX2_PATCE